MHRCMYAFAPVVMNMCHSTTSGALCVWAGAALKGTSATSTANHNNPTTSAPLDQLTHLKDDSLELLLDGDATDPRGKVFTQLVLDSL